MTEDQNESWPKLLVPFLALGLLSFGLAPIIVKYKPDDLSPVLLAAYRTIFATLLLLPFWWARERKLLRTITGKQWALMALAGSFLGLHFVLWISSLSYTSVASASVLVTIHPVMVIVAERFGFGRKYPLTTWLGVLVAFSGVVVLSYVDAGEQVAERFPQAAFGNLLAFSAAVVFVVYFFLGERVRKTHNFNWLGYVFPLYLFSAVSATAFSLFLDGPTGFTQVSSSFLWVALLLAIGPQILGHGSLNFSVKYIQPTLLSSLILIEPAFSALLAVWLFAEIPTFWHIIGMLLTMAGIALTWLHKMQARRAKKRVAV